MARQFFAAILLFTVLFRPFAGGGQGVELYHAGTENLAHATLHWEGDPHHHDDGSSAYHQDDSEESLQHVLADAGTNATALLHTEFPLPVSEQPASPAVTSDSAGPSLYLDGPKRPPRLNA